MTDDFLSCSECGKNSSILFGELCKECTPLKVYETEEGVFEIPATSNWISVYTIAYIGKGPIFKG